MPVTYPGELVTTSRGSLVVNGFGFGVHLGGFYTVAEIFQTAIKYKPENPESNHPAVSDWNTYNNFTWVPWSRLNPNTGEHIARRCKMVTYSGMSDEVFTDYVGTGDSVKHAWMRYIPTSERIGALTRFGIDLNGVRVLDLGCGCGNNLLSMAAYGMDVYGMDAHPEMYNQRHDLLRDRILFGDALSSLHVFKNNSFDVVIVSMLGSVWWNDVIQFLSSVGEKLHTGGIMMLDTMPHKHVALKAKSMYKNVLPESGVRPRLVTENMIVGMKV